MQTVAPCSIAIAAEDGVHNGWARSLSVVHETAQDIPVPLARIENPRGWLAEPASGRGQFCGQF